MNTLTPQDKLELATRINQLMDDFFAEKQCRPDEDVLLLAFHARADISTRRCLLSNRFD